MTWEELIEDVEKFKKEKEEYKEGKIDDEMTPECRKNWIEKCNS